MGHFRVTIGHLKVTVVHLNRVTIGHLRLIVGYTLTLPGYLISATLTWSRSLGSSQGWCPHSPAESPMLSRLRCLCLLSKQYLVVKPRSCASVCSGLSCGTGPRSQCWRGYGRMSWQESHSRHTRSPLFGCGDVYWKEGRGGSRFWTRWCREAPQTCPHGYWDYRQISGSLKCWSSVTLGSQGVDGHK